MSIPTDEDLEEFIDAHSVEDLLSAISDICYEKAEHIATNWQDEHLAADWEIAGGQVDPANMALPKQPGITADG